MWKFSFWVFSAHITYPRNWLYNNALCIIWLASSKQDKPNPTMWLATWTGKMALPCPGLLDYSGLLDVSSKKMLLRICHLINYLWTKMAWCPHRSFFFVCMDCDNVSFHKEPKNKKNNIQLSWPRASPIVNSEKFTKLMHSRLCESGTGNFRQVEDWSPFG